ncbi:MAG: class I SAM-dependent methyltransferase [Dermatophilaceae bacterium]
MDTHSVDLLTSARGWALLSALPPYDESSALPLGEALREGGYEPALVAAALTQARLRARARDKLGEFAEGMLFSPDGLEQATRLEIAARHARRFRDAGVEHVWDLGCGIGADAMACAALGLRVSAVDVDPATAAIARVNLRHFPDARVLLGDAAPYAEALARESAERAGGSGGEPPAAQVGVWLDPARRLPGVSDATGRTRRAFRLDQLTPSWETVLATAAAVPATGAKLSPSLPHAALAEAAAAAGRLEAQWVSYAGEVVECGIWFGPLTARPGRSALVVRPGSADGAPVAAWGVHADELADEHGRFTGSTAPHAPREGEWIYDPDRAVVRAGLVGVLAARTEGAEVSPGAGYVLSDRAVDVPWARRYAVIDTLPLSVKPLRAWLRARGIGRLVLKKRAVSVDPDRLRRDLRLSGEGEELTCILTQAAGRPACVAVRAA